MSDSEDQIKTIICLIILTFQPIVLAILFMSIIWNIPLLIDYNFKILGTLFSGIITFAIGSITFLKSTQKLMKKRSVSK